MLEQKEQLSEEQQKYKNYDANHLFKFRTKLYLARRVIKLYGLPVFLGKEDYPSDCKEVFQNASFDERMEMYRLIEQNDKASDDQLAKEAFKISEYYGGI